MPWKGKPFGWARPIRYINCLPEPEEAGINVARQIAERLEQGPLEGEIVLSLNYMEAPSAQRVFGLMLHDFDSQATVTVKVDAIPSPDPRDSQASFSLWKFDDHLGQPAVAPPGLDAVEACCQLATAAFNPSGNWLQAQQLAQTWEQEQIPELLAVMVHPPAIQDRCEAWVWLPRIQLAAALLVAAIEQRDGILPEDSFLLQVIQGPIDWTTNAAVIALTQWSYLGQHPSDNLQQRFLELLPRLPNQGYWSTYEIVLENLLLLPDINPELRSEVDQTLERYLREMAAG